MNASNLSSEEMVPFHADEALHCWGARSSLLFPFFLKKIRDIFPWFWFFLFYMLLDLGKLTQTLLRRLSFMDSESSNQAIMKNTEVDF